MKQFTIHYQNESLDSALHLLAKVRECRCFIQDSINEPVTENRKFVETTISRIFSGMPTFRILEELLVNSHYRYFMNGRTIIIYKKFDSFSPSVENQKAFDYYVRGKIVDEDGKPLSSVGIAIFKTTATHNQQRYLIGSGLTDNNGNFEISVTERDGFLIVSYLGYSPRIVHIKNAALIKMEPDWEAWNEVTIIGGFL